MSTRVHVNIAWRIQLKVFEALFAMCEQCAVHFRDDVCIYIYIYIYIYKPRYLITGDKVIGLTLS